MEKCAERPAPTAREMVAAAVFKQAFMRCVSIFDLKTFSGSTNFFAVLNLLRMHCGIAGDVDEVNGRCPCVLCVLCCAPSFGGELVKIGLELSRRFLPRAPHRGPTASALLSL